MGDFFVDKNLRCVKSIHISGNLKNALLKTVVENNVWYSLLLWEKVSRQRSDG